MKHINKLTWLVLTFVLTLLLVGCTTATGVSKSSDSEVSSKACIASDITSSSEDSKNQEENGMPEKGRTASAVYYMPDLSAYPNLDEVIGLPPYEIHVYADGSIVDFDFVTKNSAFKEAIERIDEVSKADGFSTVTSEEYTNLSNGIDQFKQGKPENTYIKPKNNNQDVTPYAIQIIDGGIDKNNLPIIIVKMAGGDACSDDSNSQKNKAVTENDTRANAVYYMPDLTAYPNLDEEFGLPPYEIYTDGSTVDFKFVTKNIPFEDMINTIDERLKADGFTPSTEEQYTNITNSLSQFKQGKAENTYIKLKNNNKDVAPYAIQIINSGVDKNNLPIVTVKMAG